jgi:uncharacterized membrane protein YjfL (UPF0719 family)
MEGLRKTTKGLIQAGRDSDRALIECRAIVFSHSVAIIATCSEYFRWYSFVFFVKLHIYLIIVLYICYFPPSNAKVKNGEAIPLYTSLWSGA